MNQRTTAAEKSVEKKERKEEKKNKPSSTANLHILTRGYSGVLLRSRSLSFSFSSLMGRQEPSVKYSISSISSLVSFNISESSLEKKTAGQSERSVISLRNINLKLNCGGLEDIHPLKHI